MTLIELLDQQAASILGEAQDVVQRSHLEHYEAAGLEATRARLQLLYDLTVQCVKDRNLAPLQEHAEAIARERFNAGFDLAEVQTAYNVLEEVIWKRIFWNLPPEQLAEGLGLVGTALGAGKDRLAQAYVSLASKSRAPSLNLQALFKGRSTA
jgi:hypothetical protein